MNPSKFAVCSLGLALIAISNSTAGVDLKGKWCARMGHSFRYHASLPDRQTQVAVIISDSAA